MGLFLFFEIPETTIERGGRSVGERARVRWAARSDGDVR